MNPISVLAVGLGAFLLWYAFTGNPISDLLRSVIPVQSGQKK